MYTSSMLNSSITATGSSSPESWSPPTLLLEIASGDDELIVELIETFQTDTRSRICQIQAALENADFPTILAEAHTIKGSARQIGAVAVGNACQELEAAAKLRDASLAGATLEQVEDLFERSKRAMSDYSVGSSAPVESVS